MLLDFYRRMAESARVNLTECNELQRKMKRELSKITDEYEVAQGERKRCDDINAAIWGRLEEMENRLDRVKASEPELWQKLDVLNAEHKRESDACNDYRRKANEAFEQGDILQSRVFRQKSIDRKNRCVELQGAIGMIEIRIDQLLMTLGADFTHKEYRCQQMKLRRIESKINKLEDRLDSLIAKMGQTRELCNLCSERFDAYSEQLEDAWEAYYKIAFILGDIPERYRGDAKIVFSEEENQTKIIFGEAPNGEHGHVQINNLDDSIVYYRMPGEPHGRQNFVRARRN